MIDLEGTQQGNAEPETIEDFESYIGRANLKDGHLLQSGFANQEEFMNFVIKNNMSEEDLRRWAYFLVSKEFENYNKSQTDPNKRKRAHYNVVFAEQKSHNTVGAAYELFDYARRHILLKDNVLGKTFTREDLELYDYLKELANMDFGSGVTQAVPSYTQEDGKRVSCYRCNYCNSIQHSSMTSDGSTMIVKPCHTCGARLSFEQAIEKKTLRQQKKERLELANDTDIQTIIEERKDVIINKIIDNSYPSDLSAVSELARDFGELTEALLYSGFDVQIWYYRILEQVDVAIKIVCEQRSIKFNKQPRPANFQDALKKILDIVVLVRRIYSQNPSEIAELLLSTVEQKNRQGVDADADTKTVKAVFCLNCKDAFKVDLATMPFAEVNNSDGHKFELINIECDCCGSDKTSFTYIDSDNGSNKPADLSEWQFTDIANLQETMLAYFSTTEAKILTRNLGFDFEDLSGGDVISVGKTREIIGYCQRRGLLNDLIMAMKNFKFAGIHAGEVRNVKCAYCGTLQTISLNSQNQIEGKCSACNGVGYSGASSR